MSEKTAERTYKDNRKPVVVFLNARAPTYNLHNIVEVWPLEDIEHCPMFQHEPEYKVEQITKRLRDEENPYLFVNFRWQFCRLLKFKNLIGVESTFVQEVRNAKNRLDQFRRICRDCGYFMKNDSREFE